MQIYLQMILFFFFSEIPFEWEEMESKNGHIYVFSTFDTNANING